MLDIVLFKAIVLSKVFQMQTTKFGFACTKIVGNYHAGCTFVAG